MENNEVACVDSSYPYTTDILVRLSVITKGPLLERRREIRKSLVLASLSIYPPESEFEVKELSASIKGITKCELDDENIISILDNLKTDAIVQHLGGLKYRLKNKVELPEFRNLTQPAWGRFSNFFEKAIQRL